MATLWGQPFLPFLFLKLKDKDYSQSQNMFRIEQMQPKSAGTNTRSAPRRHAPRRPCCSLCSARARSDSETTQPRTASVWELGSVAPLFPPAPIPFLRNRFVFLANIPTEAAGRNTSKVGATLGPDRGYRWLWPIRHVRITSLSA